ncbi:aminotransferase class V-fold PLP-dependent enzyme [Clostridium sp. MB40-C1]|uniref:aminotransferase class I/II-fold pyridoxal phosphate-dependent enzyme n=1 Tax=Clostridium sp. MB40-C1 TaxID=3070996 RepID=UPI0027E03E3C|nr:aminotransferase class V-fold PLP-dependent enzyme [Clostridium sp. MB40-C1]WMJ79988.1 aminotransferase class V-fold PLP-dependent enzyme [Clostridium sp. MB40-C1]
MSKLPLVEGVLNYIKQNNTLFCMPGHKGGKGFLRTDYGRELYDNIIKADITEVEGLDNLHNAEGIIKEAQELLAKYYESKKSYFLVNGSSSGNLTMIFSSFDECDKVIVERNCHKSIFNGIILRKLKPVFIKNKINKKYDAPLSIDEEHFLRTIEENEDAKGIILTYPNYYGICPNLEFIIKEAQKRNMKVLVDCAHGAHFGILKELPRNPIKLGADMVVMSSHKTLPSFTQTAYLHIGKEEYKDKVEFYLHMFLSTSPSYMLMCSMDYARFYLEEYGEKEYRELLGLTKIYRGKINNIKGFYILGKEDLDKEDIDLTRYVLNIEKGYSASKFSKYLKAHGIQVEMNDGQNVVLIFSPFNDEKDFRKLYDCIKNASIEDFKGEYFKLLDFYVPEKKLIPFEVIDKTFRYIDLNNAEGKICAKSIIPYPPGVPIVTMGEIIDKTIVSMIKYYLYNEVEVIGVTKENKQYKIQVIDK